MSPSPTPATVLDRGPTHVALHDALELRCAGGATGILRLGDRPGTSIVLVNGKVEYAESPEVSGVVELLTASGRLSADLWSEATTDSPDRIGPALIEQGHISGAELEIVARTALHSALLSLLDVTGEVEFEEDARHPFGPLRGIELDALRAEVDRRRELLEAAWPDGAVDTSPVRPARRLAGSHVALNSLQWAILMNADRVMTPSALSRHLGLDTFAVMLEVRRLGRAGLVEVDPRAQPAPPRPGPPSLPRRTPGSWSPPGRPFLGPVIPYEILTRIYTALQERL